MNPNWISVSIDSSIGTNNYTCSSTSCLFYYPCSSFDICTYYSVSLSSGSYLLEVWGGEGGGKNGLGGKGGYSRGSLFLSSSRTLFLYLGSKGDYLCNIEGHPKFSFNGGGFGFTAPTMGICSGSGGGGTDFRVSKSMNSRILVAGGGGGEGSSTVNNDINTGGYGGGLFGGNGSCVSNPSYYGSGANLTSPGSNYYSGTFGYGGNNSHTPTSGGGGGGWFGGGAGYGARASGGGGSGYFYSQHTLSPQNSGLISDYYLESAMLLSGNDLIPIAEGGYRIGNYGSGVVRITYLSPIACSCDSNIQFSSSLRHYLILHLFTLILSLYN